MTFLYTLTANCQQPGEIDEKCVLAAQKLLKTGAKVKKKRKKDVFEKQSTYSLSLRYEVSTCMLLPASSLGEWGSKIKPDGFGKFTYTNN